ncbi:Solute:sodium symporter [Hibiscus syriacus]|uniref:Solute:sodium symporter n=1 Tax=Hibiscus syriacus TaxID=106335 RepID=A0A6A3CIT1_HIBSY|nr:trihelix transcription factor GT-3b-like [Hibiscus syriacus]KAE8727452.1 Solute:sodium symporter [Hibiscus syriacus]
MLGGGQWGQEETRELIFIRGELERDFTATKHNKTFWEVVSSKMKDRGFTRTPDQCNSKWKNLLNRYKGKETAGPENDSKFPFFEELRALFTERAKNMKRRLLETEAGSDSMQAKKRMKRTTTDRSSDEFSEQGEDEDESEEEKPTRGISRKRRKADTNTMVPDKSPRPTSSGVHEVVREFFNQQLRLEMQWGEMMERRARERQLFEQEWQQSMEKLERERLMVEKAWREREEEKRRREESRAERRDSLLTTLLNELINDSKL